MTLRRLTYGFWAAMLLGGCTNNGSTLEKLERAKIAEPPQTISLEMSGYVPHANHVFHNLFVSNFSVKVTRGDLEYSTARDGLSDALKQILQATYGFGTPLPDSNGNGYSDLIEFLGGITYSNQAQLYCGTLQQMTSSNDAFTYKDTRLPSSPTVFLGLRNCEKSFMQLKPLEFDYDNDGIPDYLEVRNGLNPKNPSDARLIAADDGVPNIEKVKRHIPIDEDARSQPNRLYAYKYETNFDPIGARIFKVSNIPVLQNGIDNFIAIYVTETDAATHKDTLYSAYLILHRSAGGTTIRIPFWGNDPSASATNQEILQ